MSYAAEKWARAQKTGNARAKAVLLELANCFNSETGKCCPSLDHICEVTELQRHTVISAIKFLVEKGFIEKTLITTQKGRASQYRLLGFTDSVKNDTVGSVETDITHGEHSVNSDTMGSVKFSTTDSVKNDTRTSNKNKEIEQVNTIRENSPSDDFSLEPVSEDSTSQKIQSSNPLSCPYEELATLYNQVLGQDLGECRKLSPARKTALRSLWNECIKDKDFNDKDGGLAYFKRYFTFVRNTPFLVGKETAWKANFDWILKNNNYIKICEGFYNRPRNAQR